MYGLKSITLFSWGFYVGVKEALIWHITLCLSNWTNYKYVKMGGDYISGCRLTKPAFRQQKIMLKFISESLWPIEEINDSLNILGISVEVQSAEGTILDTEKGNDEKTWSLLLLSRWRDNKTNLFWSFLNMLFYWTKKWFVRWIKKTWHTEYRRFLALPSIFCYHVYYLKKRNSKDPIYNIFCMTCS